MDVVAQTPKREIAREKERERENLTALTAMKSKIEERMQTAANDTITIDIINNTMRGVV